MTITKCTVYLLVFNFLVETMLCTVTPTKEPPRRPFITSDNIPPFLETDNVTSTTQESSDTLDNMSDEASLTPGNHTIDDDRTTNIEERGSFGDLSQMHSVRSKTMRRQTQSSLEDSKQVTTLPPMTRSTDQNRYKTPNNNDRGRQLQLPFTDQDQNRRVNPQTSLPIGDDRRNFGKNDRLFASGRGVGTGESQSGQDGASLEDIPPLSDNRQLDRLRGISTPTPSIRDRQRNQQGYQPGIGQYGFPSAANQPDSNNGQINTQGTIDINGAALRQYLNNDRGRQQNQQGYQPFNTQSSFPPENIGYNNRQSNQQPTFSAALGRDKDILGSVNQPFADKQDREQNRQGYQPFNNQGTFPSENTKIRSNGQTNDRIICDKRGLCNTVTQNDMLQNTYKLIEQLSSDRYETSMCFTEIVYITEFDNSDAFFISKEFVWTIETADHRNALKNMSCDNPLDAITTAPVELTNTERLEDRVVKKYRVKHCGIGNIFKHEYATWPDSDKKMIQVTISNGSPLQCRSRRDRSRDFNYGKQQQASTLHPFAYRSTVDANLNTYVTDMPTSVFQPGWNTAGYGDNGFTPGPPIVQAQHAVEEFEDNSEEDVKQNLNDYMKVIIDCVLKNKNFKGMCPHSKKARN
ncbi:unnamed protein product [Acanthoscelides obtectus]|uniref:Uncharacterized protein n=1 Tax=Acanthoscelides obtectus TaxID=200917 RepID=A0A9P0LAZ2_ACAOB|nr:unnamed protein product [Acanthoscelides obtectus]CAK1671123.1 hypothetical protein AOBTE_LOCUS28070 [Acanthoscelides obtectus]